MVFRTIYISSTRRELGEGIVDMILDTSRQNNRSNGLTGLLVYDGKRFLQYLEGDEHSVRSTIARIRSDERHYALVILSEKETSRRQFSQWSMAGHRTAPGEVLADSVRRLTEACDPDVAAELVSFAEIRPRAA